MKTNILPATEQLCPDDITLSFSTEFGSAIKYYDDGMGPLWIMRDSMGIVGIVRAMKWHDAYSIVEDEFLPVVSPEEIHEAYDMSAEEFHSKTHEQRNETGDWPELTDGYSYQSNSTGTGIVSHDLNGEALDPLTVELCERLGIQIIIKFAT